MLTSMLEKMHASGSYMGRDFCVVADGPAGAVGHSVTYMGNTLNLQKGMCSPLAMGGNP